MSAFKTIRKAIVVIEAIVLAVCAAAASATAQMTASPASGASEAADPAARGNDPADALRAHLRETRAYVHLQNGHPVTEHEDITSEYAQREAKIRRDLLARLDTLNIEGLSHDQWLLAQMLRHSFASGADGDKLYWLNPVVTPYVGGSPIQLIHQILAAQQLKAPQDLDCYLRLLAELERKVRAFVRHVGFPGAARRSTSCYARTHGSWTSHPAEIEQRSLGYLTRIEPLIPQYFSKVPPARYGVKRLDPAVEPGMTLEYYQQPTLSEAVGYYRYNGSNLDRHSLATVAHMIYHELTPDHHFHIGPQSESKGVNPVREFLFYGVFTERWNGVPAQ